MTRWFILALTLLSSTARAQTVSAVPATEPLSDRFTVTAGQTSVPVYLAKICALSADERIPVHSAEESKPAETSFASFDLTAPTQITVTRPDTVQAVKILPTSRGIVPTVSGKTITFTVTQPGALVLEVNGDWIRSLQLFANPPETDAPHEGDPNVIYYGPGIHEVESVKVTSGQTVYLAPGAVVYGTDMAGAPNKPDAPVFLLSGSNITVRGRGIIDGSLCPRHTRNLFVVRHGSNVRIEGIVLRDSSTWTFPVTLSDHVDARNVKILGWRNNSDGIDICNSRDVEVSDCYLRTFDDLVVLKTNEMKEPGEVRNITVKHCVLWNEFAHALSLGAELRQPVSNVFFSDCDVIHDKGREWLMRVYNCDSADSRNIVFDHIRVEEARRLFSLWIGHAIWSKQADRGHIENVTFQDIVSPVPERPDPWADLVGVDAEHAIDNVLFQRVMVGGRPFTAAAVRQNEFAHNVVVTP